MSSILLPPHTALLPLPDILKGMGLNVVVLDGWETAQCSTKKSTQHYLWTSPDGISKSHERPPNGFMVHHTAGTSAKPVVKTLLGTWSKANAWLGLMRNGKLYTTGEGIPTIVLASAGPARISSGYGFDKVLTEHTFKDIRPPWKSLGADTKMAGNRYVFNLEVVHPGDGSELDSGVWEHIVGLGVALHQMFDWQERTLGHVSWTTRKIDPHWNSVPNSITAIQDEILRRVSLIDPPIIPPPTPNPPDPEVPPVDEPMEDQGRNMLFVKQGMSGQAVEDWQVQAIMAVKGVKWYGNSAKNFIITEAPELTWKQWNQAMTDYLSAWTRRNSYGIGGTEKNMIEDAVRTLYAHG